MNLLIDRDFYVQKTKKQIICIISTCKHFLNQR